MKESETMFYKAMALMIVAVFAAGCNTIEGMGKDLSKAGDKIEEAAKKK
jgi:predicted small secreted protein